MDDYSILIGAAPTKEELQKMTAASLRRRRSFGELGQLTGDKVLAPMGASLSKQADAYAEQIQQTRQMDADNAQTKAYQDWQAKHAGNVLAETKRGNNLDYSAQMAAIRQREMDSMLDFNKGGGDKEYRKFTDGTRNKMLERSNVMGSIQTSVGTFKPEYTQKLGPGPQSKFPNALAGVGIGTKGSKEAQLWWADWEKFYTLPERNLLFGATLTPNEQAAWKAVNIHPGMDPETINKKLKAFNEVMETETIRRGRSMVVEGFDPEVIKEMYADTIPDADFGEAAAPQVDAGGGRTRYTKSSSESPVYGEDAIKARLKAIDEQLAESGK